MNTVAPVTEALLRLNQFTPKVKQSTMTTTRALITLISFSTIFSQLAFAQAGRESAYGGKEGFVEIDGVRARYLVLAGDVSKNEKPRPVWIGLHGVVGCSEHAMWAWHDAATAAGAILIAPQGTEQRESDGEGYNRWHFERDSRSLLQMVEEVGKTHPIDRERVAIVGFSHGGSLALKTVSLYPEKFHFAAVIAAGLANSADEDGLRMAAQRGVPMFYACGEDDEHVAPRYSPTLTRIKELGFKTTAEFLPKVGHDPRPFNKGLLEAYKAAGF